MDAVDEGWWPGEMDVPPEETERSIWDGSEEEVARRLAEGQDPDTYSVPVAVDEGDLMEDIAEERREDGYADSFTDADAPPLEVFTLEALMERRFARPYCVVEGLLPPGLALLASPPKYGKSWLALDLCLSVVSERPFLGHRTNMAHCLYLALEDSEARLQSRAARLLGGQKAPPGMLLAIHAENLSGGLYDQICSAFDTDPFLKLVVIDTLQKIRGNTRGREGAYQYDYREMTALKQLADSHGATVLLVHHLNKGVDDGDPHNRINGTTGILGAADTSIVLTRARRSDETTTMSVVGRDVESVEQTIRFDAGRCRWELVDTVAEEREQWLRGYEENPIVLTLRKLLEQNDSWKGTCGALMAAGRELTGFELATSPKRLNMTLRSALESLLWEQDHIRTISHSNGNASTVFEFRKAS